MLNARVGYLVYLTVDFCLDDRPIQCQSMCNQAKLMSMNKPRVTRQPLSLKKRARKRRRILFETLEDRRVLDASDAFGTAAAEAAPTYREMAVPDCITHARAHSERPAPASGCHGMSCRLLGGRSAIRSGPGPLAALALLGNSQLRIGYSVI